VRKLGLSLGSAADLVHRPYLPQLIPVEVPEPRAKEWLQSLVSAVDFCHRRGIVHNDIKYNTCSVMHTSFC
jgi:serine/threonine protein kinase